MDQGEGLMKLKGEAPFYLHYTRIAVADSRRNMDWARLGLFQDGRVSESGSGSPILVRLATSEGGKPAHCPPGGLEPQIFRAQFWLFRQNGDSFEQNRKPLCTY